MRPATSSKLSGNTDSIFTINTRCRLRCHSCCILMWGRSESVVYKTSINGTSSAFERTDLTTLLLRHEGSHHSCRVKDTSKFDTRSSLWSYSNCVLNTIAQTLENFKMHLLRGLVLCLLPTSILAAKKPTTDRFVQYHTKALASAPLKFDDSIYAQLTTAPRDYSVAVLLTALEARFGCTLCREFQPEWDLLSRSWTKGDKKGESRLLYGTLDFSDGKNTFQSVSSFLTSCLSYADRIKLGLQTAPVLLLFQPTTGQHAVADSSPLRYDFSNGYVRAQLNDGRYSNIATVLNLQSKFMVG